MFKQTHHRRLYIGDKSSLENANLNQDKYVYIPIRIAKFKKRTDNENC